MPGFKVRGLAEVKPGRLAAASGERIRIWDVGAGTVEVAAQRLRTHSAEGCRLGVKRPYMTIYRSKTPLYDNI